VVHRADALRGGGAGGPLRRSLGLGYFALLGLSFITVEIALLQKFAFFLGHPSYALVVVLFAILVATALGAKLSGRVSEARRGQAALACGLALAVLCGIYALTLNSALRDWVGWSLPMRVLTAGGLAGVCGVLMGIMLPTGIKLVGEHDASIVPWGWGINGATSVIGTVLATIIAIHYGFTTTLVFGAVGYAIAGLVVLALHQQVQKASATRSSSPVAPPVERAAA
jgi:MFS family permease